MDNTILAESGSLTSLPNYLFVYGTLQPSFNNAFAQYLRQQSHYLGNGTFPGVLFDVGNYPGAIYQADSHTHIWGSIYEIGANNEQLLHYLDDYEGIGKQYPQPNEYVRVVIPVSFGSEQIGCWVYLYNLPVNQLTRIETGNYEQYLNHQP